MKDFFKEPLVYFLLIGGFIFLLSSFDGETSNDGQEIIVDRLSLLRFIQQKTKVMDRELLVRSFESMPEAKRQDWITAYVREEALYREGQALGLGDNDPIIKSRVIQNLGFITQEYSEAIVNVSDTQLEDYFAEHKKDYFVEPYVTFTHVFFSQDVHGDKLANTLALKKLQALNKRGVSFSESVQHGDRFPFHVNYVERTPAFVTSHFGKEMSEKIFNFSLTDKAWRGPYTSSYGSHLVLLARLERGRQPDLTEVTSQVYQDTQRQQLSQGLEQAYQAIINSYAVTLSQDLAPVVVKQKIILAEIVAK